MTRLLAPGRTILFAVFVAVATAPGCGEDGAAPNAWDAPSLPQCGNGTLEMGEECDDGNFVTGDGCDNDCTFTCHQDLDCDDHEPCNGVDHCTADHRCQS